MSATFTVADVAAKLNLKAQPNGKFSGAPEGTGATKDGFVLCPEGNAFSNGGDKYTSAQVAELAGIDPSEYEPVANFRAARGHSNGGSPNDTGSAAPHGAAKPKRPAFNWNAATKFDYHDETGVLLYQVGRLDFPNGSKDFRQRQPDGAGEWVYNLDGVPRVLYLLADVKKAERVIFCEGEKTATAWNEDLKAANLYGATVATTTAQGAGNTLKTDLTPLHGKAVAISPDNNPQGQKQRDDFLNAIGERAMCKVIELPDRGEGGDYVDFRAAGGTLEQAFDMMDAAPVWTPQKAPDEWPLLSLDELFARPEPTWLIDLLFPDNAVAWITASHASFKSVAALDSMMCVATGTPFHGRDVRQGRAIYVAAEGISGIRQRAKAWLIRHQLPTPSPENIAFIERPVQIGDAAKMAAFIRQMEAASPDFLVIDTQARCSVGMDENSTSDSTVFWGAIADLARATGAAILVVHHNNKSGEYRGNSNAPASVDVHLSIKRDGQKASLRCLKQKDADEENAHINFVSRVIDLGILDAKGRPQTSIILEATDEPFADEKPASKSKTERTADAVLEVLTNLRKSQSKVTKTEWEEAVTTAKICSRSKFYDHTKALETARKWAWEYGDCVPSPESPESPEMDEMDEPEFEKSRKSRKSTHTKGVDYLDYVDEPAPTKNQPKQKPKKKSSNAASEPYGAAPTEPNPDAATGDESGSEADDDGERFE